MRRLSAVNLGILLLLVLRYMLVSVEGVAEFGWTMFNVREMKITLGIEIWELQR